jgi:hypothetical protein
MGVSLWGESALYVNPGNVGDTLTEVLAEGRGGSARLRLRRVDELTSNRSTERDRLKEARVQSYELTNSALVGTQTHAKHGRFIKSRADFIQRALGENSLPYYGPLSSVNRPCELVLSLSKETRMLGGVGRGELEAPLYRIRLCRDS